MKFSADRLLRAGVLLAALYPLQSYAATINGTVCEVDDTTARNAANAETMSTATSKCATFTTSAINYDQQGAASISTFLNNPTFINTFNGFSGSDSDVDFLLRLTGQTFLNAGANSFVLAHDDGAVLTMPGISSTPIFNAPGPTSENDSPVTVNAPSAGLYDFVLDYGECCSPPAVLKFAVNGAPVGTPEPSTMMLIGSAFVGLGVARFRKRA
jgi:hypothetical protein